MNGFESTTKVQYIGQDRKGSFYWFVLDPELTNIIFVSTTSEDSKNKSKKPQT